jgi:hypothetical protein
MRQLASHGTVWFAASQPGFAELLVFVVILVSLFAAGVYLFESNAQFEKDDGKSKTTYTCRRERQGSHGEGT